MGAQKIIDIISAAYGGTGSGGTKPAPISLADYGQGSFIREDWYDECILIKRPSKEFQQLGTEQMYEKDTAHFEIVISSITSQTRYEQIVTEVRRIFLAYTGSDEYSRLHLNTMNEIENSFWFRGSGMCVAYINLARART